MDRLALALGHEEAELKQLVAALEQEQDALKTGDTDRLEPIVAVKNRLLDTLGRLGRQRNQALAAGRWPEDRPGLIAWAKANGRETQLENFLQLVDRAKELNRVNGQLIALRLTHTQSALAALAPERAPGQGLYGPKGQTRFTTGYRLIDTV